MARPMPKMSVRYYDKLDGYAYLGYNTLSMNYLYQYTTSILPIPAPR